jgi:hypothetical protein
LAGWLVGWLVGWLAGWLSGWLVGWLAGWLVHGWREVCNKAKIIGLWYCGFWLQSDGRVPDYRYIIG